MKLGKFWSDQVMIIITFIPVSVTIVVLILWSVLDPVPTATPVPLSEQLNVFPRVTTACGGSYGIYLGFSHIIFGVNGSTIV